jgi:hypothetical protein
MLKCFINKMQELLKNRIKYISRIIKNIQTDLIFLESQTEDFFLTLSGLIKKCRVNPEDLDQLLFLIIHLRLQGGLSLSIEQQEQLFLINDDYLNFTVNNSIKEQYLIYIHNDFDFNIQGFLKNATILTCNRPEILEITLKEYINIFI